MTDTERDRFKGTALEITGLEKGTYLKEQIRR